MNKPIDIDWMDEERVSAEHGDLTASEDSMCYDLPPYTMEELNARIDEAEEQIARGEVLTAEEADLEFERFLASLESQ